MTRVVKRSVFLKVSVYHGIKPKLGKQVESTDLPLLHLSDKAFKLFSLSVFFPAYLTN